MNKNLATALMAIIGLGLLSWAALDWAAYGGFTVSLLWK